MNVQQEMRALAGGSVFGVHTSPEMLRFGQTGNVKDARRVQDVRQRILSRAQAVNQPRALLDTVTANNPGILTRAQAVNQPTEALKPRGRRRLRQTAVKSPQGAGSYGRR